MPTTDKTFRASLVITSQSIGAAEIQTTLGITASDLREKGSRLSDRPGSKPLAHSAWILESGIGEDRPIDQHAEALADLMEKKQAELAKLAQSCSIEIWCYISFEDSQCGFALKHHLLDRLAALSCDLVFDIYR